jgi:death-on-curing family protein
LFYLTPSVIKKIHDFIIESQGGVADGQRPLNEGNIKAAAERPWTKLNKSDPAKHFEPFSSLCAKVTALGYALNRWHGFTDGNKRTSLMCMVLMLYANGAEMTVPVSMTKSLIKVADDRMSEEDFEKVIRRLSSSNKWAHRWKSFRHKWLPEAIQGILYDLPILNELAYRMDIDWLGAGDEEAMKRLDEEYEQWERLGYPKNDVELELADTRAGLIRDGDLVED